MQIFLCFKQPRQAEKKFAINSLFMARARGAKNASQITLCFALKLCRCMPVPMLLLLHFSPLSHSTRSPPLITIPV
jgi:hypothetical protein